jgi:hypothetical protein
MQMNVDSAVASTIERGAELFAYAARGRVLHPQQRQVGAALDELKGTTAILMARRSAKTESVLLWVFAMMEARPGLKVAFTMATTREAARAKFLADVLPVMEELAEHNDAIHLLKGAGYERVDVGTSFFQVLAPTDKAFRSKEFDIIIVDEAGEAQPDVHEHLLPAMLPTLDTSDLGMLILMGTAGEYTTGNLLYDALHDEGAAVVDYSLGDAVDVAALAEWPYVAKMLKQHHPGIGTLTTLDRIKRNWALLKPDKFAREYLGVWGDKGGAGGLFSADDWASLYIAADRLPSPPKRFALAVAATETHASIVAAWREEGEGRLLVLAHRPRRSWLPAAARDIARRYRMPIVVDPKSSPIMADVKQRLEQLRPAPRIEEQTYEDVAAAHERIVEDILEGRVRHYGQDPLTGAFLAVQRQQMGARWKFGRATDEDDITSAQAATLALRYYDAMPRTTRGALEAVAV